MKPVILVVGCPGSGKSWVCKQLTEKFAHVPHDDFKKETDYSVALAKTISKEKAVLGEIPFGLSQIQGYLQSKGHQVKTVFIFEQEPVLRARYLAREGRAIIPGHLTRQNTYRERAHELGSFVGTSEEVLKYLQNLAL